MNMLHVFWTQDVSKVHMDHAKFCFKAVFKPFLLQWKYSWDQNIKFIFLSSAISQLPRFLFSVCNTYSLSSNALEATCGFTDSWLIIPFSQLNFDGPCLAVYKDLPQRAVTLPKDHSHVVMWVQQTQLWEMHPSAAAAWKYIEKPGRGEV